ncbi:MAG TPA: oxidoreductase [Lentisphaeria bacterium]|nr:oxidoreductase [Lentisphaeria bacterium]|tara:strand:+ start:3716 stop:4930 length:1215 start_codon:yes stop_codon:yes gene_type:complete
MKKIKIGITGAGSFAQSFIPLFKAHPNVTSVALAEVLPERRHDVAAEFQIEDTYESHEALCSSDVDAVAIITQRHMHGPQALEALNKGKHVYSAVPAAITVEEIEELVSAVAATGLMYMMGETSYYYPAALYCRERFSKGEFGAFVYGEGEYLHDMSHGFYEAYQHSGGEEWQKVAGIPPMYYPTHSTSMIISVTGASLTQVSCLGYTDRNEDNVFGRDKNLWDNPFSNQTALFRTSDGGMCRVNEFRRIGHGVGNCVRTSIYGTEGCFEQQGNALFWTELDRSKLELSDLLRCKKLDSEAKPELVGGEQDDFFSGLSDIHPIGRLPREFTDQPNGHYGSHQFLVDDFVRSVVQNKLAPNHVWAAARYTVPGIIAHESAKREGELLKIPDFGDPGADCDYITYE